MQLRELEGKVRAREAEFESYRQQVSNRPESKLHAELSILQLEKVHEYIMQINTLLIIM